jgi:hypothetical protein
MDRLFFDTVNDRVEPDSELGSIIQATMTQITRHADTDTRFGRTGCLLADIGEYLVFLARTLSEIAEILVRGRHVDVYNDRRFQEMEDSGDDFTDLSPTHYLSDKLKALESVPLFAKLSKWIHSTLTLHIGTSHWISKTQRGPRKTSGKIAPDVLSRLHRL